MKRCFTLLVLGMLSVYSVSASGNSNDSVQHHLQTKIALLEKHLTNLQQQVISLEKAQRNAQAELRSLQQAASKRSRQLVIERRGSKQASFQ